jgi:hypothetical protein
VAETVLQNKEDCIEIDKRMSRVILSQLEKTEMLEEQDMENALTKLLETFLYAHSSWIARVAALPPSSFADHHLLLPRYILAMCCALLSSTVASVVTYG